LGTAERALQRGILKTVILATKEWGLLTLGETCASKRGWEVLGEFVDIGVSGSKDHRPQLDTMMRLAKTRKVDVIVCWKLDRFGRSLRHLVDALAELQAVGCAFVSLRHNLDLTMPAGRMMFHVIGAMAEFERELIRERVKAGLAHARSKGRIGGRPKVKRERDKDAGTIRAMRADGDSYGEIAEALNRTKSDIYRVCMTLGCQSTPAGIGSPITLD
jgi:DNA invertase Pin-like site-specific DNA recombinase